MDQKTSQRVVRSGEGEAGRREGGVGEGGPLKARTGFVPFSLLFVSAPDGMVTLGKADMRSAQFLGTTDLGLVGHRLFPISEGST